MTFPKSSANKKSAAFDLKQAFSINAIIGVVALLLTAYEFVISVLSDFSYYVNNAFADIMTEIPASPLTVLGNAEYLEKFRENTTYICSLVGEESMHMVVIICAAIGAMFSLCFAYSMSKKNVNFYYSIPIDRATMFKNRITTAVLWIVIVFAVPILLDLLLNIGFFGFSTYLVKMALTLFAECLIYALASFTICTIGIVACYTIIEGVFFAGALYTFPTALMIFLDFLCSGFLRGYNRSTVVSDIFALSGSSSNYFGDKSFLLLTSILNPVLLGTKLNSDFYSDNIISLCNNQGIYDPEKGKLIKTYTLPAMNYIIPLLIWAVLIVAGTFLAKYIFTHKKMENASMHASNRFATGFFALQLSLSIAGFFAVLDINSTDIKLTEFVSFLVMLVIIVAVYYITVSIGKRKAFHDVKTYVTPLIAGGVVGAVCLVLGTGLFGYANVPAVDKIECATITANGMVDATYSDEQSTFSFPFKDYYGENIVGVFSEKEDLEKFAKVAEAVSSSNGRNMENCSISIVYKLKDGKTISRNFNVADKAAIYSILSLTDTKEFKENLNNFILKDAESNIEILNKKAKTFDVVSDVFGDSFWDNGGYKASLSSTDMVEVYTNSKKQLELENTQELRQALAKDLAAMTFEQRFKPTEKEICTLSFVKKADYSEGEMWEGKSIVSYDTAVGVEYAEPIYYDSVTIDSVYSYAVYPSMKNTVAYLNSLAEKQKTLIFATDFKFEDLKFVKATVLYPKNYSGFGNYTRVFSGKDYNYYDYVINNGFTKTKAEITDKAKMAELFDLGKGKWYIDDNDLLVLLSTDKKNDAQEVQSVALIIPKEDIPNWLKAEIKK